MPSNRMVSMLLRPLLRPLCAQSCAHMRAPARMLPACSAARQLTRGELLAPKARLLLGCLHRILHRLEGGELDILQLAVNLLDLAHVDVLDDITRVRIDR